MPPTASQKRLRCRVRVAKTQVIPPRPVARRPRHTRPAAKKCLVRLFFSETASFKLEIALRSWRIKAVIRPEPRKRRHPWHHANGHAHSAQGYARGRDESLSRLNKRPTKALLQLGRPSRCGQRPGEMNSVRRRTIGYYPGPAGTCCQLPGWSDRERTAPDPTRRVTRRACTHGHKERLAPTLLACPFFASITSAAANTRTSPSTANVSLKPRISDCRRMIFPRATRA